MISEITLSYNDDYLRLGKELNNDFEKLFKLDDVLSKDYNKVYGYIENNKLLGFIHLQISIDEADIINIVVDEKYRRRHIASKLIDYSIKKHDLKALNIEVKENNPAVSFYQKIGFKTLRIIPRYYNDQDAYFMKKVI